MAWCPQCKREYEEGTKVCGECGTALTEEPAEQEGLEKMEEMEKQDEGIRLIQERGNTYVKKADRYNDFFSSGIMLIVFGVLGLLSQYHSILIFCLFMFFGIGSLFTAFRIKKQIGEEEIRIEKIKKFLQENVTPETIKEWEDPEEGPEANYLAHAEHMKKMVLEFAGEPLEEAFLESVIEEYYTEYLEKK